MDGRQCRNSLHRLKIGTTPILNSDIETASDTETASESNFNDGGEIETKRQKSVRGSDSVNSTSEWSNLEYGSDHQRANDRTSGRVGGEFYCEPNAIHYNPQSFSPHAASASAPPSALGESNAILEPMVEGTTRKEDYRHELVTFRTDLGENHQGGEVFPPITANQRYRDPSVTDLSFDSGYGSVPAQRLGNLSSGGQLKLHVQPHTAIIEERPENDKTDTMTIYSEAESLQTSTIQGYISDFADELHSALAPDFGREGFDRVAPVLGDILQDFAIRFGHEQSNEIQRHKYIMYIMYKHRRYVDAATVLISGPETHALDT